LIQVSDVLVALISALAGALGTLLVRRKTNAEAAESEARAQDTAANMWKKLADNSEARYISEAAAHKDTREALSASDAARAESEATCLSKQNIIDLYRAAHALCPPSCRVRHELQEFDREEELEP
jgi:Tfp pilus assembly protein PilV